MPLFSQHNYLPVASRLVVVTGGSQGTGLSVACQLAAKGANIAIIALDPAHRLDSVLEKIRSCAASAEEQHFFRVSANLCAPSEVSRALQEITEWNDGVPAEIIWQCHGGTHPMYFVDATTEGLEGEIKTNYLSCMYLAHTAIKEWVAAPPPSQKRQIIFTASVAAFIPLAGYNVYTPAKAALRALADGLRQECLLYDIEVRCCFPATILTPGFEEEKKTKPELTKMLEGADTGQTPDEVARVCINKLEGGDTSVVTTLLGELLRSAMWGSTQRGGWWLRDVFMGIVGTIAWALMGRIVDRNVVKYRKLREQEGGRFRWLTS